MVSIQYICKEAQHFSGKTRRLNSLCYPFMGDFWLFLIFHQGIWTRVLAYKFSEILDIDKEVWKNIFLEILTRGLTEVDSQKV